MEERLQLGATPAKWDMIVSGKWTQKVTWNRWVTTRDREQTHTTPVIPTWTTDFLTREGEGHKAMVDWVRDKTISWKTRRRLLQTNVVVFPYEIRLQKWDKQPDGICELCKSYREMGLKLSGGKPTLDTTGHLQSSVCRLQVQVVTGDHV
jgi:hypothetical protein